MDTDAMDMHTMAVVPQSPATAEDYDLLIVADRTYSMDTFLKSLHSSMQDMIRIAATTACFTRIGVLGYCDYDCGESEVTAWSGWHSHDAPQSEVAQDHLLSFVKTMKPLGGQSFPEAAKTGLAHAYQVMRPSAKTVILLFTDAPPHTQQNAYTGAWQAEQDALRKPGVYGGTAGRFADWASAATALSQGEKQAQVFSIIEPSRFRASDTTAQYTYLAERTGGICLTLGRNPTAAEISKLTVGLLIAWMGADKQGARLDTQELATHAGSPLSLETLAEIVPRREQPVMNLSARYRTDPEYKDIVVAQLGEIIESGVSAITLNPVFGTLWRTVCNDRLNPARDGLIARFGLAVDRMGGAQRASMRQWLEESYDWAGDILHMIQSVPAASRYPCVFLDPTLRFGRAEDDDDDDDDDGGGGGANGSSKLTRDELLELGRSCDYRILRRLSRVLTQLTYAQSDEALPAHIKAAPEADVPRIPLALAQTEYGGKFWKLLLHTVLPGTMLAARPAALLAALSLRMGIKPLEGAASTELLAWRDNWNTLDIPETWNTNCLGLLLEADRKHQQLLADSRAPADENQTILRAGDRALFQTLVDYKLLELNLDTTLEAVVGWTPDKTTIPMGPTALCETCQFPRSVTVMSDDGICGLCASVAATGCPEGFESADAYLQASGSKTDHSTTPVAWTECSMADCRAQYVVYHTSKLNVRPKCHYCRQQRVVSPKRPDYARLTTAPCVTCTRCLNRIVWPAAYRPSNFNPAAYTCPACAANHRTTTALTTTARALAAENGTAFLLANPSHAIPPASLFTTRSIFHTITHLTCDRALLPTTLTILPPWTNPLHLTSKPLHNTRALLTTLRTTLTTARPHRATCTLCLTPLPPHALRLACGGRRGCRQPVCAGCVRRWYGANAVGRAINVAALACPFCRRAPVAGRGLLPRGLRALPGLGDAGCGAHWCWECGVEVATGIYEHILGEHGGWDGGGAVDGAEAGYWSGED
ncbi:hypothetical protein BT67DRAFT_495669 [Trichocladium antarcticum]|uniref:RING-type domain-containing protein n=1 Tax=Trichocladium antarcticum TaxID=1450529 RepID=A0AAN6ULT7_9PEZI|nr:hypothetical protein BT67DRAFT_495669 [Trichocladium antarcticum]